MSKQQEQPQWAHDARVDAVVKQIENVREEFEERLAKAENEIAQLKEENAALAEQLEAIGAEEVDASTPDARALKLRKWLYEEANGGDGMATADVNVVAGVLGGCHREQRYEAMRRAADGDHGAKSGSSKLSPVDAITFQSFDPNDDRNTRVVMDTDDLTENGGRKILTTDHPSEGALE